MKRIFISSFIIFCCTGCLPQIPEEPPMTQLQVREMESREFETNDMKAVMKSMMNVLQDEGFVLKNVVLDLGLINAKKNIDIDDSWEEFQYRHNTFHDHYDPWGNNHFKESKPRWKKQEILEASANISEFGNKVRVRISFQQKSIDNHGNPMKVKTITKPKMYQDFFEKVSKGIFIQEANI